ncbi:MAG: hypothetical protein K8U57_23040 [Planctomycetes bacterium]|nr:hypothetical protein [Planctomycetota bacterium]
MNRPRGLCWSDFYTPGVRDLYPLPASKHTRRGPGADLDETADEKPDEPTPAMQGTLDKMRAMAERAERGVSLFHRLDGLRG